MREFVSDFVLPFGSLVAVLLAAVAFGSGLADSMKPEPGAEPPPCDDYWVVTPGDTLWSIARYCYPSDHTGRRVDDILRANPGLDPGRLRVGQVLQLPAVTEIAGGAELR